MKKARTFDRTIETAIQERVEELIRKYDPGPFFEDWAAQFTTGFKKFEWNSEKAVDQAMVHCLFGIERLLKTWREDVGPSGKQTKSSGVKDPVSNRTSAYQGDGVPLIPLLKS
ncbi:MAG: hypothetical protein ACM3N7_10090 [Planctomycetaceae bacterium]